MMSRNDSMSIIDKASSQFISSLHTIRSPIMSARILVILAILSLLHACSPAPSLEGPPDSVISAVPVRVAPVELRAGTEVLRFASVARVRQRANLTFQVAGVIAEREVEIGQEVAQGQVLVRLYNPQLLPAGDAAQARLDQLESERGRARANRRCKVAGVIAEREVEIGQEVAQGQVLVRLYNPQLLPARDAAQARLDQLHSELKQARRDLERTQTLNEEGVLPIRDLE